MIESTFIFLPGIGETSERRLWAQGFEDWEAFARAPSVPGISPARKALYDEDLRQAADHLQARQAAFFAKRLKRRDHWRVYEVFKPRAVYVDIETTGGPPETGEVTVVGLYGGGRLTQLVRGDSLTGDRLCAELARYDLVVTFFGSVFDIPYLQAKFPGLRIDQPHLDLCFAARRLGLRGGLKRVEVAMGITRPDAIQGLDGWEAVRLWQGWRRGERHALDRLLQYNAADTRNLETLAEFIYDGLVGHYGPPRLCQAGPSPWGAGW